MLTYTIYIVFSNAFYSVNHVLLRRKLKSYGINANVLTWFSSYLTKQRQCTVVDGHISSSLPVLPGVPQGSILGPLLFLVFVNDLQSVTGDVSSIYLYGDDAKCSKTNRDFTDANTLQANLDALHSWSQQWYLRFNEQKCESMIISRDML